jgi:hypothetical protein
MAIVNLGRKEVAAEDVAQLAEDVDHLAVTGIGAPPADVAPQAGNGAAAAAAVVAKPAGPKPLAEAQAKVVGSSTKGEKSTVATQPKIRYMIFGLACLGAGIGLGLLLQRDFHPGMKHLPVLSASVGAFALLYVMAQAIERLLVPVSWFGGGFLGGVGAGGWRDFAPGSKATLAGNHQKALVDAYRSPSTETADDAAEAQHALAQYRANLTATTFGLAALAAMLVSGYAGIFLLHMVGLHTVAWLDILITGLAVAGGTKPLHDLISNISSGAKAKK